MKNRRIGFIGAGKVGITLGAYFLSKGVCVAGYTSRTPRSAEEAATITSTQAFSDIQQIIKACDMIFITTSDDEIVNVWSEIKKCKIKNLIILHTSGSLSSTIFSGITAYGAYGYSIHPLYSFSDKSGNITGLADSYFTIEGNTEKIDEIINFVSKLGNKIIVLNSKQKTLYHIATVMVSNLALALISMADDCIQMCGVSAESAIQALIPLIITNIDNIEKKGFVSSLTGPIERNDIETINTHLETVPQQYGIVYAGLSMRLTELAQQKHPERDYTILCQRLDQYLNDNNFKRRACIEKNCFDI